jgi:Na+/proline symporter
MNIYFIGMAISMAVYLVISFFISRRIRSVDDYYVGGRRAPLLLVSGTLVASYTSTGMFMGDAATAYAGGMSAELLLTIMQVVGYLLGAVFFGRYLRRSRALTIPEFFGRRFCSPAMHKLAAVTAMVTMTVYMLSVVQGIGTLMNVVTGADYNLCVILALTVLTIISVTSGSSGVLITDTLMAAFFTLALVFGSIFIVKATGGWFGSVQTMASDPDLAGYLSWGGKPGPLYDEGWQNVAFGLIYGVVWMSVCMVGPWQSSIYLMAKNEHTVIRSALPTAFFIFVLEFLACMVAAFVNIAYPNMPDSSHVLIWASMNLIPKILGVLLLTGVLAAGISSAMTFQTLIGSTMANDIIASSMKHRIRVGRITMVIVGLIVLAVAYFNPPSIFWIMYLGGAIVAASWMPVVVVGMLTPRLTKAGAFSGMLTGFMACFFLRLYTALSGASLPVWLDPSFVGMIVNFLVMGIVTALTKVTLEEVAEFQALRVMPEEEKNKREMATTLRWTKGGVVLGICVGLIMMALWGIPYTIFS